MPLPYHVYNGALDHLRKHCNTVEYDFYPQADPDGFSALCSDAIKRSETVYNNLLGMLAKEIDDDFRAKLLANASMKYIENVLPESLHTLESVARHMRGVNAVCFVGASVSFDAGFNWDTVRTVLAQTLQIKANRLSSFDASFEVDKMPAFRRLAGRSKATVQAFQVAVMRAVEGIKPAEAHRWLSRLIELQKVEQLVCFNWDNLIERSLTAPLRAPAVALSHVPASTHTFFWKPHGCVTVSERWVLPHEPVTLHPDFIAWTGTARIANRIVLCLGFSGSTNFTLADIRKLFGSAIHSYDIRPQIDPTPILGTLISTSAVYALRKIAESVDQGVSGPRVIGP